MGTPIDPSDPPFEGCPDCEDCLPAALYYVYTDPITGVWSGIVTQDAINLCNYTGLLWQDAISTGAIIEFCDEGTDTVILAVPAMMAHGGLAHVDDNHCYPFIDVIGNAPGSNHKVWAA